MKTFIVIVGAAALAFLGWHLASPKSDKSDLSDSPDHASQKPTSTVTDPTEVFQKAFWKRPTPEDQILHAERREWQDKDGLSKWQWFISVKPSPALVDHLITHNAFMLTPRSGGCEHADDSPKWFPKEAPQTFANTSGTFQILWDKEGNLLHATDSGSGFRPGAPEPSRAITAAQPEGRLPTTPPPKP